MFNLTLLLTFPFLKFNHSSIPTSITRIRKSKQARRFQAISTLQFPAYRNIFISTYFRSSPRTYTSPISIFTKSFGCRFNNSTLTSPTLIKISSSTWFFSTFNAFYIVSAMRVKAIIAIFRPDCRTFFFSNIFTRPRNSIVYHSISTCKTVVAKCLSTRGY